MKRRQGPAYVPADNDVRRRAGGRPFRYLLFAAAHQRVADRQAGRHRKGSRKPR